jgi:hypothetical protein
MTDPAATSSVCPWCSAEVPAGRTSCPACGANLVEASEAAVPGLTAIDAEAVLRNIRTAGTAPRRSRILSLITGEEADEAQVTSGSPTALAPPPLDVRREMLRMEIAAELSNLTAEVDSIAADEALEAQPTASTADATPDPSLAPDAAAVADAAASADPTVTPAALVAPDAALAVDADPPAAESRRTDRRSQPVRADDRTA